MNGSVLRILFLHELKMLVRARRTVVMAIVLPAVIMPLMLYAQKYSADRRERLLTGTVYRFAVSGESADRIRRLINQTRRSIDLEQGEEVESLRQFRFVEATVVDAARGRGARRTELGRRALSQSPGCLGCVLILRSARATTVPHKRSGVRGSRRMRSMLRDASQQT